MHAIIGPRNFNPAKSNPFIIPPNPSPKFHLNIFKEKNRIDIPQPISAPILHDMLKARSSSFFIFASIALLDIDTKLLRQYSESIIFKTNFSMTIPMATQTTKLIIIGTR